ncbi:hypothetical protein HAX54_019407 [Datura stramonium]|uniref:Uncharacterized protein n=1 Tax=Datura stramonium TaxID=4076 RepID=A0ABS8S2F9_DATST|nr:hypothetical protein [Datura stramonium]
MKKLKLPNGGCRHSSKLNVQTVLNHKLEDRTGWPMNPQPAGLPHSIELLKNVKIYPESMSGLYDSLLGLYRLLFIVIEVGPEDDSEQEQEPTIDTDSLAGNHDPSCW